MDQTDAVDPDGHLPNASFLVDGWYRPRLYPHIDIVFVISTALSYETDARQTERGPLDEMKTSFRARLTVQ